MIGLIRNIILLLLVVLPARVVVGAETVGTLTYAPTAVTKTIPAGASASFPIAVDVVETRLFMYTLTIPDQVIDGNLPRAWITSPPSWKFLRPGTAVESTISISVPLGTPSGTYAGHLTASARGSHGLADPGSGVLVSVIIPPDCSGVADIRIDTVSPEFLWPPNHELEDVTISGTMSVPAGCSLLETGYALEDEYGAYSAVGAFSLNQDNSFRVSLPLEAWRAGNDLDGRRYSITLFGRDEAGIGSSAPVVIQVPHDQRK